MADKPLKKILPFDQLPQEKAGFVIYGRRKSDNKLCVLTSYSQGRFSTDPDDRRKYYGLAKGAIDDTDKSPMDGAIRETAEETGINVRWLLGAANLERLKCGERLENIPAVMYKGVEGHDVPPITVKSAHRDNLVDYDYISGAGVQRRLQLYYLEVDGIENLEHFLKKPVGNKHEPDKPDVQIGVVDQLIREHYPRFEDMLQILRTGVIPMNDFWGIPKVGYQHDGAPLRLFDPVLPEIEEHLHDKKLNIDPSDVNTWIKACEKMDGEDFKKLKPQFAIIKKYFEDHHLIGDTMGIKLDDKDCPMCFYIEGGEVLPLEDMVMRSLDTAQDNKKYAKAMWGAYNGDRYEGKLHGVREKFPHAQISGLARVFGAVGEGEDVANALRKTADEWVETLPGTELNDKRIDRARTFADAMRGHIRDGNPEASRVS